MKDKSRTLLFHPSSFLLHPFWWGREMRTITWLVVLSAIGVAAAGEVESRALTHYLPQDFLETAVRTEGWTEVKLALPGNLRKGDVVRIWAGGLIDRGNGEQPGENVNAPSGLGPTKGTFDSKALALSQEATNAFAMLFKTEPSGPHRAPVAGKPLEIKITRDAEKVFVGFNDERGRYADNHLGRGRRHELDPAWVRIEVVRIIID
jgi:hypothetical protein